MFSRIVFVLIAAGLVAEGLDVLITARSGRGVAFAVPLLLILCAVAVFFIGVASSKVVADEKGVFLRSLFRTYRLRWSEVERVIQLRNGMLVFNLTTAKRVGGIPGGRSRWEAGRFRHDDVAMWYCTAQIAKLGRFGPVGSGEPGRPED
jgi:hypothetical protein